MNEGSIAQLKICNLEHCDALAFKQRHAERVPGSTQRCLAGALTRRTLPARSHCANLARDPVAAATRCTSTTRTGGTSCGTSSHSHGAASGAILNARRTHEQLYAVR